MDDPTRTDRTPTESAEGTEASVVRRDGERFAILYRHVADRLGDPYLLAVYYALASHASSERRSWPGVERIGKVTGMSASTVRRCLRKLEALGVVDTVERYWEDGGRASNGYLLLDSTLPTDYTPRSQESGGQSEGSEAPVPGVGEVEPLEENNVSHPASKNVEPQRAFTGPRPKSADVHLTTRERERLERTGSHKSSPTAGRPAPAPARERPRKRTQADKIAEVNDYFKGMGTDDA